MPWAVWVGVSPGTELCTSFTTTADEWSGYSRGAGEVADVARGVAAARGRREPRRRRTRMWNQDSLSDLAAIVCHDTLRGWRGQTQRTLRRCGTRDSSIHYEPGPSGVSGGERHPGRFVGRRGDGRGPAPVEPGEDEAGGDRHGGDEAPGAEHLQHDPLAVLEAEREEEGRDDERRGAARSCAAHRRAAAGC